MTSKIVTYLEGLFAKTETTVEAAWDSTASAVETTVKTAFGNTLPKVLGFADQAVAAAALTGGTAEVKWEAAFASFTASIATLNLTGIAVNVVETVLQMAVTKLESVKAA